MSVEHRNIQQRIDTYSSIDIPVPSTSTSTDTRNVKSTPKAVREQWPWWAKTEKKAPFYRRAPYTEDVSRETYTDGDIIRTPRIRHTVPRPVSTRTRNPHQRRFFQNQLTAHGDRNAHQTCVAEGHRTMHHLGSTHVEADIAETKPTHARVGKTRGNACQKKD